jgi:protein-disulfide isomerase
MAAGAQVDTTIWQNDLVLGNPNAPILITVACNPYCGPCAKAHKQLDDLLYRFTGKLKVQVRLLCDAENETDKRAIAVKAILQKAEIINTTTELQQMLTDWFVWMDFEKWDTKWKADGNIDVAGKLKLHNKWIEEGAIQFTPTFFINGRKLPGRYALKDIEILIPQLEQILTNESVK